MSRILVPPRSSGTPRSPGTPRSLEPARHGRRAGTRAPAWPAPLRALAAGLLLALLALPACDNGPETAATVLLSLPSATILVGQTVQLTTTVQGKSGKTLTDRPVTYASSAPTVAAVTTDGQVVGLSVGSAVITATADGVTGTVSVVVAPVPVASVTVTPASSTIAATGTVQLAATALDAAGISLPGRSIAWASASSSIATVSNSGLVTGVAPGTTTITATSEGKTGQATVTVTAAPVASIEVTPPAVYITEGHTFQMTATPRNALGQPLTGRPLVWTSSDTSAVQVDGTGLVTGVAEGFANIVVSSGGVFGSASVFVLPIVVGSVHVSPDSLVVALHETGQFTVTVRDTSGAVVDRAVTWRSLDTAVVTVDASGTVTAVGTGTASVVAAYSGAIADTASVRVTPAAASYLTVAPDPAYLGLGQTGHLAAEAFDVDSLPTPTPLAWSTSDSAVATVDSAGVLAGVGLGTATVYVRAGTVSETVTLNVVTTTVASLDLAPATGILLVGYSVPMVATPRDGGGTALVGRTVTFYSSNLAVASISPAGVVTGLAPGATLITAVSEGHLATAVITVQ